MSKFFAFLTRMKYILRWSLMRNTRGENIAEHSYYTATIAHVLAVIRRDVFGIECDPGQVAVCAMYHDVGEILTGDMPTPIKYMNPEIRDVYKKIEQNASKRLTADLPQGVKQAVASAMEPEDEQIVKLVKAADKLSAYLKCIEEENAGNSEFTRAQAQTLEALKQMHMDEVDYFLEKFVPACRLTLDELE